MDRFEGRCWLDWWANSSTLLGSAEIAAVITATSGGWDAQGQLVSDNDEEREGFGLLYTLDPVFTLRFEDESTILVTVHTLGQDGQFAMTEYNEPCTSIGQPPD